MIAVKALKGADTVALMTVKALRARSWREETDRAASRQTVRQTRRPLTRGPTPRAIRARIAAIFSPGCLLPHVEPYRISASAHIPPVTTRVS
jgi:hypothetical protein